MQVVLTVILDVSVMVKSHYIHASIFLNKELARLLLSKEHFRSEYIET